MKTSTSKIRCDWCGIVIPVLHPTAVFLTLRGPAVGHKKGDFCNEACLAAWADKRAAAWLRPPEACASAPPEGP